MVGAQQPNNGVVRIDGTDIRNWDPEQLGSSIGYLSQEVRLLPGTVKQNIARLSATPDDTAVLEAARKAQVHELIQGLPQGYDTLVGAGGFTPSVGQRQRIALARAFYGNPQIMVLDEPNANLDDDGEAALKLALDEARKGGATVVLITQRKQVLSSVDKIMRLHSGKLDFFGTNADFVKAIQDVRARNQGGRPAAAAKQPTIEGGTNPRAANKGAPKKLGANERPADNGPTKTQAPNQVPSKPTTAAPTPRQAWQSGQFQQKFSSQKPKPQQTSKPPKNDKEPGSEA